MKLCFLDVQEADDGWLSAAVLVTDADTRPSEFRITDPIHTDEVQRVLYGSTYEGELYGTCLTAPLLEALQEDPDVVLVRDQKLLVLGDLDVPVLWIGRDAEAESGFVVGSRGGGERVQSLRAQLSEAVSGRDLLEPFERIETALTRLAEDAQRARA